ncbi:MAG: SRPBCC family protein [Candidatus Limnocylindria bacterium]
MPATNSPTMTVAKQGDREIVMSREFDAPRELVFKAMTDPLSIPKWWGRRKDTTVVDTMDVRPGGKWRFLTSAPDGDHAFRGEFREIVPPERIVQTFEWEGLPGHISVETMVLEERGAKTLITSTSVFDTKEDRDGMWDSGMESGARQTWDRLTELLSELQRKVTTSRAT